MIETIITISVIIKYFLIIHIKSTVIDRKY